ncbi:hypothetical protein HH214_00905 [Mucilaginibacter robiniae]|uniref:Uncharacterized protein n=1 Tax=Mucilaginibacter robiniae TaxID=2728022 RepID=A0A7L5DTV3_9SPHI|nr:hypothetical protein [Mucilaginibacter robiniae]QJD94530.1 hypothetical protein HH214_00905 [Mucilaginibacter robiniae]
MKILKTFALLLFTAMTLSFADAEAKTTSVSHSVNTTAISPQQHWRPGYGHRVYRRRVYRRRAFYRHRMMDRHRFYHRRY